VGPDQIDYITRVNSSAENDWRTVYSEVKKGLDKISKTKEDYEECISVFEEVKTTDNFRSGYEEYFIVSQEFEDYHNNQVV
jgi:hypothetical protein